MSSKRSGSWERAARHPLRTLCWVFGLTTVAGTIAFYFDGVHHAVVGASLMALACAVIVTWLSWRRISSLRGGRRIDFRVRPVSAFGVVVMVVGIIICDVGVAVSDSGVAASGLPLVALGAVLIALRMWAAKKAGSSRRVVEPDLGERRSSDRP